MGKYNLTALRVRQTALRQKACGKISKLPPWADVVADIPPTEVTVRRQPVKQEYLRQRVKTDPETLKPRVVFEPDDKYRPMPKKPKRMFLPQQIKYEEDELRKEFYRDHPWELARPRIVLETTGNDSRKYDWSKIEQPGKKLDGESVVQRQLWLLQNVPDMTKSRAYDIARREFYKLRLKEDIQRWVAAEEAEATGAFWGPSMLEVSMDLENKEFERWKAWAKEQAQVMEQKNAQFAGAPEATLPSENSLESTEVEEPATSVA